jgi:hypothetical protein
MRADQLGPWFASKAHVHIWDLFKGLFVVTEADAAAIRAAFDRGGELSAAVELRRVFPGVTDMVVARECARTIAD